MSCCGGNCGCGAACKCGNGCGGCKMHPDVEGSTTSTTLILGVAPEKGSFEGRFEMEAGSSENGGCKCGANCSCACNPCTCACCK